MRKKIKKTKSTFCNLDTSRKSYSIFLDFSKDESYIRYYVKFTNSRLSFLYFIFHFHFHLVLFSYFSIFRTARVRVRSDQSHCHVSHNLMVWSQHWSQDLGE